MSANQPEEKNIHVLVVDDDANIRMTLTKCLSDAGYSVTSAVDGRHAIEKMSEQEFQVALLDVKLPDMDGLEILRRTQGRKTAVIMITGYGTVETAVEAMKLGAVDYLRKPFTPDEIRTIVRSVANRFNVTEEDTSSSFEDCLEYAKALLSTAEFDKAYEYLKKAAGMDPQRPEPLNLLGVMHELQGDLLGALKMYRAALGADPTYAPATSNLTRGSRFKYTKDGIDMGVPGGSTK